ncbi:MAG: hypothetical protein GXO34_02555, partial [Deltaproteobacteria bacterium]|nr:hypothetical protein [Deltaproteobacteria bacterium]
MKNIYGFLFTVLIIPLLLLSSCPQTADAVNSCVTDPPFLRGRVLTDGEIIIPDPDFNRLREFKYYSGENSDSLGEISGSPDRNLEFYDELVAAN